MSILQKTVAIIGILLLLAVFGVGLSLHFPLFLIFAAAMILGYVTMNLWWLLDISNQSSAQRNRSLFFIANYPDTLWAFCRYLREKRAGKVGSQEKSVNHFDKEH